MNRPTRPSTCRRFALRPLPLALAIAITSSVMSARAGNSFTDVQQVVGATITNPNTNTTNVNQSAHNAYIQAGGFNIGANDSVKVFQPGNTSNLLIQVTGYDPSAILGQLQANGRVFLSNPNGVLFGAGARIDVGSLVATNLSMDTAEFMRSRIRLFDNGNSRGSVVNAGTIKADGTVALVGTEVSNLGSIEASRVGLAALSNVVVDVEGDGLIFFQMSGERASAKLQQLGSIKADGGLVELRAQARGAAADTVLNMDGLIQAHSIGSRNGQVIIDGGSTGITKVTGTIDVQGIEAGETGGTVKVLGDRVALSGGALIDASGDAGGGTVLIGGDYQGGGDDRRASHARVVDGATIKANAITHGDGGKVVVWSDGSTAYQGLIEARGGAQGGNGGTVEVSGKQHLAFWGAVDTSAAKGLLGSLLLDPDNIFVISDAATPTGTLSADFDVLDNTPSSTGDYSVRASAINASTANITLAASNNITVDAAIDRSVTPGAAGRNLTLTAGNSITVNASIKTNNGDLTLNANSGNGTIKLGASLDAGSEDILLNGNVSLANNVSLTAAKTVHITGTVNSDSAADVACDRSGTLACNLTITSAEVEFDKSIGVTRAINDLTLTTANLILDDAAAIGALATSVATINGTKNIKIGDGNSDGTTFVLNRNDELSKFSAFDKLVIATTSNTGTITFDGSGSAWALPTDIELRSGATGTGTGTIAIKDSVRATTGGIQGLTITTAGQVDLGDSDNNDETFGGGGAALAHLIVSGSTINLYSSAVTSSSSAGGSGAQTYTGLMVLRPHAPSSSASHTLTGQDITLGKVESVTTEDNQDLTIVAGNDVRLTDTIGVGALKALHDLDISSNGTTIIESQATAIATSGTQIYRGNVRIATNTTLSSASQNIEFQKTVDADAAGAGTRNLTLSTPTANRGTTFKDTVGATNALGVLTVSGIATIATNVASVGNSVTATSQVYNGNVNLVTGNTTKVLEGDSISFATGSVVTATGVNLTLRADALTLPTAASVGGNTLTISQRTAAGSIGIDSPAGTAQDLNLSVADLGRLSTFTSLRIGEASNTDTIEARAALTLSRGTTFVGDTSVTLLGVTGAANNLTLTTGNAIFNGNVSGVGTLSTSSNATLNANLTATTAISIAGATTLGTGDTTTTRSINSTTVTLTNGLATGNKNIAIRADTLTLGGTVTSSGSTASVSTRTDDRAIALQSGTAAADLEIDAATLAKFSQFGQLNIGRSDSNSAISATTGITLPTATTLLSGTSTIALSTVAGGGFGLTLTGSGDTTLSGAFTNVGSLVANGGGKTVINTDLTTTTSMDFASTENVAFGNTPSAVTLRTGTLTFSGNLDVNGKDTTLRADSITLTGSLQNATGAEAVILSDSRSVIRVNTTSADTALDISTTLLGKFSQFDTLTIGSTATGTRILTGAVTLAQDTTFASGNGGGITLGAITGGGFDLTTASTSSAVTFAGNISGVKDLSTTGTASGITISAASIATTGTQTYNADITLGSVGVTLSAPTLVISGGHTIAAGNNDLTLRTDAITLGGATSTGGDLTLATFTNSKTIGVFGGAGDLQITSSLLSQFTGFGTITIGRADSTAAGTITVGDGTASVLTLPTELQLLSGAADIVVRNAVASSAGILGITSTSGDVTIAQDIGSSGANLSDLSITTGGDITLQGVSIHADTGNFNGKVVLASNTTTPSITTTTLAGGTFTFAGDIIGTDTGANAQSLDASGVTLTRLQGDIGVTASPRLKELHTGNVQVGKRLFVADLLNLGGNITLTGDTTLQASSVTLGGDAATHTVTASTFDLTLATDTLTVNLASVSGGDQWRLAPLTAGNAVRVSTTGGGVGTLLVDPTVLTQWGSFNQMTIGSATTGAITIDHTSAISLGADLTLQSGSGNVTILSALQGAQALTIDTDGTTFVQADLGSSGNALTSVTITGETEFAGGASAVAVRTSGAQDYQDDVTIGNATTLSTTAGGVRLRGLVNAKTGSSSTAALTVDTTGGSARFDGNVGGLAALNSLTTNIAQINAASVTTQTTQTYHGGVTLGNAGTTTLTGTTITFDSTVSGTTADTQGLAITGNAVFGGAVGTNSLRLASLQVSGTSALNGGTVFTDGGQTYTGEVTLGANTTLTSDGGDVRFSGAVKSDGTARSLAVNTTGLTRFASTVGAGTGGALSSLTTDTGGTTELAANVTTTGAQTYNDQVDIDGNVTLAAGSNVGLLAAVNAKAAGVGALTINTSGTTRLASTVGATRALSALATDVGGTTVLGGNITTTGTVNFADAVTLDANLTIAHGGLLTFGSTLDGAQALTLDGGAGNAAVVFTSTVGGGTALASLTTVGTGSATFQSGATGATTTGAQQYGGNVVLTGSDKALTAGSIDIAGSLSGANGLTLTTNGLSLGGSLSGTGALVIRTLGTGTTIGVGTGASGTLNIAQNVLDGTGGFSSLQIGRADGTGAMEVGNASFGTHTTLLSGSGVIELAGAVNSLASTPVDLHVATSGSIVLRGDLGTTHALREITTSHAVTTPTAISIAAAKVTLQSSSSVTLNNLTLTGASASLIQSSQQLVLAGDINLSGGGTLGLVSTVAPTKVAVTDSEYLGNNSLSVGLIAGLKEASAGVEQTGGKIITAAGTTLYVRTTQGASINLMQADNDIQGGISAVSGRIGESVNTSRLTSADGGGEITAGFVRVASKQINVLGQATSDADQSLVAAGIEGDAVLLSADRINTSANNGLIRARLPYDNNQGTLTAVPGLTLLLSPTGLNGSQAYGGVIEADRIQVSVGNSTGGYITVRPKGGASLGPGFVSLAGLTTMRPFYDGSGKVTEVPVFYNGDVPQTPQEVGALSAVTAVIEESRRQRFEEAVRTENVSARLRSGVIAEVGAGRPATEGSDSIRMPASCTPAPDSLSCQ